MELSKLKQKAKEVFIYIVIVKKNYDSFMEVLFFLFKKVIQAESDELRRQDANKTALAAIGPRKKRKIEDSSGSTFQANNRNVCG